LDNINNIILGCIENDHKCQRMVYDHYRGYALKIVFRYIYHYEKAVDVVNDGFVKVFRSFGKFVGGSAEDSEKMLMGWMKKIMVNTCIDALRKNSLIPEMGGFPEHIWEIPEYSENAEQLMFYKDLIILIKELPKDYRLVFNLFVIDGYTHQEIAALINIPVGTSKSNLSRARELLKKRVKKIEEVHYAGIK
jgi:RNA polymerase sigma factor (sigma-70 family)